MSRNRSLSLLIASAFVACSALACSRPQPAAPPDTRADEATIRTADADFAKSVAAKDLDKCVSIYTDDAVLFFPGVPAVVGKDNIRKFYQQALATPNVQVTYAFQTPEVARSGDLAMELGSFQVVTTDKKGNPSTSGYKFVLVWKKQADASWKVSADTSAIEK